MRTSIDSRANIDLIEENYRRWQQNPESVDSGWSAFFEGFELGNLPQRDGAAVSEAEAREAALQTRVDGLVYGCCARCSKPNHSRSFCTRATWDKNGFHFRARNRSW